ncbi:MAG: hypothetical protein AAF526_02075 [Pseudomonadota bacterium]
MTDAALSGGDLAVGRIDKSLPANAGQGRVNPMRTRTSARKFHEHRLVSRDVAAHLVRLAFPSPSDHARSNDAARALGCSPDTVLRILGKHTDAKFSLLWPVMAIVVARHGIAALEAVESQFIRSRP